MIQYIQYGIPKIFLFWDKRLDYNQTSSQEPENAVQNMQAYSR